MAPTSLFHRLKDHYYPQPGEHPVLSVQTAALLSVAYTVLYVLPFYLSKTTRPSPTLTRDAPTVIRARIRAVILSCLICSAFTLFLIIVKAEATPKEAFQLLGWWPIGLFEIGKSLLLTSILFAGPLFEKGAVDGEWRDWIRVRGLREELSSWFGYRNYVIGPITEELLFRSLLISLHLLTSLSHPSSPHTYHLVLLPPLYFGIAHIHHFYEFTLTHPHTPRIAAFLRSLFQFSFTTVFGWYASWLFLRTGSLWAVILVHAACNWIGLPRLWGRLEGRVGEESMLGRGRKEEEDDGINDDNDNERRNRDGSRISQRLSVQWTVAYYMVLSAGVWGFSHGFWSLTRSERALVRF